MCTGRDCVQELQNLQKPNTPQTSKTPDYCVQGAVRMFVCARYCAPVSFRCDDQRVQRESVWTWLSGSFGRMCTGPDCVQELKELKAPQTSKTLDYGVQGAVRMFVCALARAVC